VSWVRGKPIVMYMSHYCGTGSLLFLMYRGNVLETIASLQSNCVQYLDEINYGNIM